MIGVQVQYVGMLQGWRPAAPVSSCAWTWTGDGQLHQHPCKHIPALVRHRCVSLPFCQLPLMQGPAVLQAAQTPAATATSCGRSSGAPAQQQQQQQQGLERALKPQGPVVSLPASLLQVLMQVT